MNQGSTLHAAFVKILQTLEPGTFNPARLSPRPLEKKSSCHGRRSTQNMYHVSWWVYDSGSRYGSGLTVQGLRAGA